MNKLHLLGFAFGLAGADPKSGEGPIFLKQSSYLQELEKQGLAYEWDDMLTLVNNSESKLDETVRNICISLAQKTSILTQEKKLFSVVGGDHTSAIGTWSGVFDAIHKQGDIGLIWIDAHMDSHTPETTESGRLHGMPLACLMGFGYPALTSVLNYQPKLKPENVCLIGVRSYESGEAALLKRLNVRTYFMPEVKERGFATVLREAADHVSKNTLGYGLSIDLDSIDPSDAPGVDVPEENGIVAEDFCAGLLGVAGDVKLIGTEVVEFDPYRDSNHKTEKLLIRILSILARAKQ